MDQRKDIGKQKKSELGIGVGAKARTIEGKSERKKQGERKKRERSDNLKLNSHHVSVEQNSIVFIGSPQPEGNYILKQCMA